LSTTNPTTNLYFVTLYTVGQKEACREEIEKVRTMLAGVIIW
jgi:hypothetical protein